MHTVGNNERGLSFFKLEYLIHTPILFELVSAPSLLLRYDWNVGFNEIHVKNILCKSDSHDDNQNSWACRLNC